MSFSVILCNNNEPYLDQTMTRDTIDVDGITLSSDKSDFWGKDKNRVVTKEDF